MTPTHPWLRQAPTDPGQIDALLASPSRLEAVRRSQLLESSEEESFDSLTRLAASLLGVPVSFVSIIDADRDFYKSQFGFPEDLKRERQLKGRTFCHYTLQGDETLVIEDTYADPVWNAVPTVQTLGVRAYVGVPLKVDGETIGSFCVMDMQPRSWSADQIEILQQLGRSAGRELSLRAALEQAHSDAIHSRSVARAREEVVAVIAHDLRTPLQVLQLSVAVLQRDPTQHQQALVGRMATAVQAIAHMTDGLLSSNAMLSAGGSRPEAVSAAQLVHDVVSMMSPIAERAGISVVAGETAEGSATLNYAQILRALGNLIGNSIKYAGAGSEVRVSVTGEGDWLSLVVADNGVGMTAGEQARAFEPGWQGAEGMVRGDGAGLGLSIVKRLASDNGGRIEIASAPGSGTTVTMRFARA
ncbi:MAG: GAF domain-containing sensor histidine kinase [Ramlibacter sp.]